MSEPITWKTESRRLGDLIEWDKNPRQLSAHDAEHIGKSIRKFGLADPLIINLDNHLIGGHQRKHILSNPEQVVDVRVPSRQLTEAEAEELAIRLNKNTGAWDFDALANGFEVPDLLEWGFDERELQLGGFDLDGDKPDDPGAQIDNKGVLTDEYKTAVGQVWQLGNHTLVIDDCTNAEAVSKMMQGSKAKAVIADPPYGMNLDTKMSARSGSKDEWTYQPKHYDKVIGDDKDYDPSPIFEHWGYCQEIFLWGADYYAEKIPDRKSGSWLVWDKREGIEGVEFSLSSFELCWSKAKHARDIIRQRWMGLMGTESQDIRNRVHPAQKAIEVIEWILEKYTQENDIIIDPYLGSGTTIAACERSKRICKAAEIDPGYAAISIKRWEELTGQKAVLLNEQPDRGNHAQSV